MLKVPKAKHIGRDFNLRRFCVQLLQAKTAATSSPAAAATTADATTTTNVAHVNP